MTIKNSLPQIAVRARNYLAHHKKTWLPYGVILLLLTGVWCIWDGPEHTSTTIREPKNHNDSLAPVLSSPGGEKEKTKQENALVYSTAAARRKKPLGNLFGSALPKEDTAQKVGQEVKESHVEDKEKIEKIKPLNNSKALPTAPIACGTICTDVEHLVILQSGSVTRTCQAGDTFEGWYVAYVNGQAVGLIRNDEVIEIRV